MPSLPRLLFTQGDVAGVGPEIVARAWPELFAWCRPIVVGDPGWMRRAVELVNSDASVVAVSQVDELAPALGVVPVLSATDQALAHVKPGQVTAAAGRAAYDFLCRAIDCTLAGAADGIVTAPLHKEGLRAAGLAYPGHTEVLAERTGTRNFAMLLYVDRLAVAHVTLHVALRDVFARLTPE